MIFFYVFPDYYDDISSIITKDDEKIIHINVIATNEFISEVSNLLLYYF